jgi:hypothetical protein
VLSKLINSTYSFSIFLNYKEEPNPEYEPKKNKPTIVKTPIPPANAISQSGTRLLVSAIISFY